METEEIESRLTKSLWILGVLVFTVFFSYFFWFWCWNNIAVSANAESWGQFGDFVGGILNPIIAFSAFYWLANSVRLQKIELSETRAALIASQKAQEEQARSVLLSTKIQSINIMLESINTEFQVKQTYINQILAQAQEHGSLYTVMTLTGENKLPRDILPELSKRLSQLEIQKEQYLSKLRELSPEFENL